MDSFDAIAQVLMLQEPLPYWAQSVLWWLGGMANALVLMLVKKTMHREPPVAKVPTEQELLFKRVYERVKDRGYYRWELEKGILLLRGGVGGPGLLCVVPNGKDTTVSVDGVFINEMLTAAQIKLIGDEGARTKSSLKAAEAARKAQEMLAKLG